MTEDDVLWEGEIEEDGAELDVRVKRLSHDDCLTEVLVRGGVASTHSRNP